MTNLGTIFLPQLPPERLRTVVQAADDPDPEGFVRFMAGEVRPLVATT